MLSLNLETKTRLALYIDTTELPELLSSSDIESIIDKLLIKKQELQQERTNLLKKINLSIDDAGSEIEFN